MKSSPTPGPGSVLTEEHYLEQLRKHLSELDSKTLSEILADTREHFQSAKEAGRTEAQTVQSLGEPKLVAQEYLAQNLVKSLDSHNGFTSKSVLLFRVMKLIFIVAPLNFFLALGPALVFFVLWFCAWSLDITLILASLISFFVYVFSESHAALSGWSHLTVAAGLLAAFFASLTFVMLLYRFTVWVFQLFAAYARWTMRFLLQA